MVKVDVSALESVDLCSPVHVRSTVTTPQVGLSDGNIHIYWSIMLAFLSTKIACAWQGRTDNMKMGGLVTPSLKISGTPILMKTVRLLRDREHRNDYIRTTIFFFFTLNHAWLGLCTLICLHPVVLQAESTQNHLSYFTPPLSHLTLPIQAPIAFRIASPTPLAEAGFWPEMSKPSTTTFSPHGSSAAWKLAPTLFSSSSNRKGIAALSWT